MTSSLAADAASIDGEGARHAWKDLEDVSSPFIRPENAEQARLVFPQAGSKRE